MKRLSTRASMIGWNIPSSIRRLRAAEASALMEIAQGDVNVRSFQVGLLLGWTTGFGPDRAMSLGSDGIRAERRVASFAGAPAPPSRQQ